MTTTIERPPAPAAAAPAAGPPPGPPLPRWLQTLGFVVGGVRFLDAVRRRYGDVVTLGTTFDERFVLVFSPELVKQVFQGSPQQLHAGEANALLGPIVGHRSVLLLDGPEHLRHRRLMSPPFHGRAMLGWIETMREATDAEIDGWPVGEPFSMHASMQTLTLRVIVRAVFGYERGPAADELSAALRAMIEPLGSRSGLMLVASLVRGRGRSGSAQRFEARKRVVDELLLAEIARRRADPDLADHDDVFSALLLARDEHGERPDRRRGPRRAADAAARRPRDDRGRSGVDVRPAAARAPGDGARERARGRLPRCGRQGGAADPPRDPGGRSRRP